MATVTAPAFVFYLVAIALALFFFALATLLFYGIRVMKRIERVVTRVEGEYERWRDRLGQLGRMMNFFKK